MNGFERLSTSLADVAMAQPKRRQTITEELAKQLIEFGDEYADIGQRWLDGDALNARGHKLSGWFVGRKQNAKAKILISRGYGMQRRAARELEKLLDQVEPEKTSKPQKVE